ncbi:hypothetical protein HID58_015222 [Brassica napus]|uniref:Uncharacterized protein n=1 Tax=Brassica napus TaxID=3708 RepID=A0ABQ8DJE9_BRANA|nr:hypothetical protein HID58_015222 [Brassica napus]
MSSITTTTTTRLLPTSTTSLLPRGKLEHSIPNGFGPVGSKSTSTTNVNFNHTDKNSPPALSTTRGNSTPTTIGRIRIIIRTTTRKKMMVWTRGSRLFLPRRLSPGTRPSAATSSSATTTP